MDTVEAPVLDKLNICHHSLDIEFIDLGYFVTHRKGRKSTNHTILKGVSGSFKSGRLTAILGASGAGKSTLLNVLSGFKIHGVTGTILINGQERNVSHFKESSCYITQDSAMMSFLTTEETLMIAADLKLGTDVKKTMKKTLVNEILQLLGLLKARSTLVGKLSGGEQKRLSIGVELLTNPPVMFFDEPTSGLDSVSSQQMITYLKSLAQAGRTVICTIHQPSSYLFEMFDDIYLLAEGQCLYSGSLDNLTSVLEEEGFTCPKYYNRADFANEVACNEEGKDGINKLIARFKKEDIKSNDITAMGLIHTEDKTSTREMNIEMPVVEKVKQLYEYSAPEYFQLFILIRRAMICTFRDSYLGIIRVLTHLLVGLLLGTMCYDIGNDASKVATNIACLFFFILFLFLLSPAITVLSFTLEAQVFLHEHKNNWYSLKTYFIAKIISDVPLQIICTSCFVFVSYFLTGQPCDDLRPLKFWILCLMMTTCGQSMGFALGAAFDAQLGLFLVIALNTPMVLFSGFFLRFDDIVWYLRWLKHTSYYRFGFEGGMVIVYGERQRLECTKPYCHFKNPSKLLEEFGMEEATVEMNLITLFVWIVIFQSLFYFILKWRIYLSR